MRLHHTAGHLTSDAFRMSETSRTISERIKTFMPRSSPLTASQQQGLSLYAPHFLLHRDEGLLKPEAVFGQSGPLTVEIGFGMGQSLVAMAEAQPERLFVGIEVHRPGVAQLCHDAGTRGLKNLRLYADDAVAVLETCFADHRIDTLQLFFPDPWQKARHHKRRFVRPDLIALVARKLKTGGRFHMATDWAPYAEWMLEHMEAAPDFENVCGPGQYHPRPDWRPLTKFEQRGHRAGHGVWDLIYQRR